jgi:hypothetical protein
MVNYGLKSKNFLQIRKDERSIMAVKKWIIY